MEFLLITLAILVEQSVGIRTFLKLMPKSNLCHQHAYVLAASHSKCLQSKSMLISTVLHNKLSFRILEKDIPAMLMPQNLQTFKNISNKVSSPDYFLLFSNL